MKISLVSQSANPQVCKEKSCVSDPDPHWLASICKEKNYVFADFKKFLSQQKKLGPQIRKSQIANHKKYMGRKSQICKWPHLRLVRKSKKIKFRKFMDLRFAELIYGPPTFAKVT